MNAHDGHYRELEMMGVEPIIIMETIMCAGIPNEFWTTVRRNLSAALATKYLLRMGRKDQSDKELDKAANYIHRARTGRWIDG